MNFKHCALIAALPIVLIAVLPAAAFAADTAYGISLRPLVNTAVDIAFTILSLIAGYALSRFKNGNKDLLRKVGIDEKQQAMLDSSVSDAIAFAQHQIDLRVNQIPDLTVKSRLVSEAVNYVIEDIPLVLAHFGIDRAWLVKFIEARFKKQEMKPLFAVTPAAPV